MCKNIFECHLVHLLPELEAALEAWRGQRPGEAHARLPPPPRPEGVAGGDADGEALLLVELAW